MTNTTTQPTASALRLFGLCALLAVTGCFTLGRPTPPLEEYVLGGGARAAAAAPARDGGLTIGLRRLDIAPYLSTTAIVIRQGSQIVTSGFRRWGEEPSAGILRAVAVSLGTAPTIQAVDVAPWPVQAQHDFLIQLHVSHLEGVVADATATEGDVHVTASWEIIRSQDGVLVARGESDRTEAGWKVGDYSGLVSRVDKELTGLAGDLVACLGRVTAATSAPEVATQMAAVGRLVVCRAQ